MGRRKGGDTSVRRAAFFFVIYFLFNFLPYAFSLNGVMFALEFMCKLVRIKMPNKKKKGYHYG